MPSEARKVFRNYPLRDVEMLRDMHRQQHRGQGRPYSVLTRSGIFLLCAAWELYCEEVILECVDQILRYSTKPLELPEKCRRTLVRALKNDKHELAALTFAGNGWKDYYISHAMTSLGRLNTPSASNVISLILELTSIDAAPVLDPISARLTDFIGKRGDIAHRGAQAGHVSIGDLDADYDLICGTVRDFDNFLIEPMRGIINYQPWNRQA